MPKISQITTVSEPKLSDKLVGTSVGGSENNQTFNFTLQQLQALFNTTPVEGNLQSVLDAGNSAVQDIYITGKIETTNFEVFDSAYLTNLYLSERLYDKLNSVGTNGQILSSTVDGIQWITLPNEIPTLQQVLSSGNVSDLNIILTGDIQTDSLESPEIAALVNLRVDGTLTDGSGSSGSTGQVLSCTGTSTSWASLPSYSAISPLIYNDVLKQFSIQVANNTQNGYLSFTDWINFDGKQNAGNYITALTGEATASGPGSAVITLNQTSVVNKTLAGLSIAGGSISSSDSILTAFGKLQNQIDALVGGATYQGTWNAAINNPTLVSNVGVAGHYYIVSVAGNTNLNGITDWQVGDWAIFDGTYWQKVDNTDAVISVNGFIGAVSLVSDNIPEGATNLYYTDARSRASISVDSGTALTYDSVNGVIGVEALFSIPTDAVQANWTTAYNDSIVSAAVTGTSTKTLTLTQQDGGTITADWSDIDTGLTSVGVSMPSAFSVSNSPLTSNGTIAISGAGTTLEYVDGTGALQTFPILTGFVPYTGATQDLDLGTYGLISDFVQFNIAPTSLPTAQGTMYWDADKETVDIVLNGTTGSLFQDTFFFVKNQTGASIPKGTVVRAAGTVGASGRILIEPFLANGTVDSKVCLGVTSELINNGEDGRVTYFGSIRGIDTSLYPAGTILYASPNTVGGFTDTEPTGPINNIVSVAIVVNSSVNNGSIFVRPTFIPSAIDISKSLNYTPANQATTLSINGTSYDLSESRTWSVGTVTSVDMSVPTGFTIGNNPITSSGTLALGYDSGYSLPTNASQADWDTAYANRITSLTTTGTSGAATLLSNVLNIPQYQGQGDYITALTGEVTASGPGSASATLSNSAVINKVLTGLNVTGSVILDTDSILVAFGKLQNQVNQLVGGMKYDGTWDASTNTPTITSGVGTDGEFYIVNVAGNTNIDGITDWQVGDWIVYHAPSWQKVDNTDSVSSVFGRVGTVTADQSDYSAFYPLIADIKDGVLTVEGTGVLGGTGTFSANQATNATISITHDSVSRTNSTSTASPAFGGTFTAIDSITSSTEGHITSVNTKTVTIPNTTAPNNATITLSAGAGISGGGDFTTDQSVNETITFSHADTSAQASVNNSGRTFIQDITLDTYGHVTGIVSATDSDTFTGTVTSVAASAGTGISVSGSPITTSGTLTITNTDRGSSQNIFKNIAVSGQATVVADSNNDTLTLSAGTNVSIATNATTDTITINSTDQFTGTVTSVATGGGLTGGTITTSGTISHADTSSVANWSTGGPNRNVIFDTMTFDTYGHVTGYTGRPLSAYGQNGIQAFLTPPVGTDIAFGIDPWMLNSENFYSGDDNIQILNGFQFGIPKVDFSLSNNIYISGLIGGLFTDQSINFDNFSGLSYFSNASGIHQFYGPSATYSLDISPDSLGFGYSRIFDNQSANSIDFGDPSGEPEGFSQIVLKNNVGGTSISAGFETNFVSNVTGNHNFFGAFGGTGFRFNTQGDGFVEMIDNFDFVSILSYGNFGGFQYMNLFNGTISISPANWGTEVYGDFNVFGTKNFKIDHPLKPETHDLVHTVIESNRADVSYRGKSRLENGLVSINIDDYVGMTEGTFVALTKDVQCFTNNEDGWTPVRGKVEGNTLTIESKEPCNEEVSWIVVGERNDEAYLESLSTDENGKLILEPEREGRWKDRKNKETEENTIKNDLNTNSI